MSFGLLFWILMLLWLVLGLYRSRADYWAGGSSILLFVLLVLLGWRVFSAPLHS